MRRLPAEREIAPGVEGGERAELRRLMVRLADGDRAALRPAFALLWPRLRAFAARCVAAADAEDVAQAALLRVCASEYDAERDALAWALGIAAWECRTLRRTRQRRREDHVAPPDPPDPGENPEEMVIARDLSAAAEAVLGTLRPIDIETITAAAGSRKLRGATFRKRLSRALARLRIAWRARHGSR